MSEQATERIRRICLSLPETSEKLSHGEPTFFLRKRVFAMVSMHHHNDGHVSVCLPAAPGMQELMIVEEPRIFYRPPYVGVAGWVGVELAEVDDDQLASLIREAWNFIDQKTRKKPRPSRGSLQP